MNRNPCVLSIIILTIALAACASQPADPVEVIEGFFKAASEDRVEDALSYLANDFGLLLDQCYYGDDARAMIKGMIEDPVYQMEWVGDNFRINEDEVLLDVKIISNGELFGEGPTTYIVQDGLIQWQGNCQP